MTITIHKKLLDDPVIAKCFKDPIGTQLYLHIGTTHLRSQFFNEAVLSVADHLRTLSKQALHRMDSEALDNILRMFGRSDAAVARPWAFKQSVTSEPVKPGSCLNWREWNDNIEYSRALAETVRRERKHKLHRLLDAMEGIGSWHIQWKEGEGNDPVRDEAILK